MKSLSAKKVRFQHKLQNINNPKGETTYGNVNKLDRIITRPKNQTKSLNAH
jgi:hypothetical protein